VGFEKGGTPFVTPYYNTRREPAVQTISKIKVNYVLYRAWREKETSAKQTHWHLNEKNRQGVL
jgi:hypothetical protein